MQALRLLSIAAVLIAVTSDAQAQRWRRAYSHHAPYGAYHAPYGVTVAPFGYSVRTPYYSYGVSPGYVAPSRYSVRYGWPGVDVRVERGVVSPAPSTRVEVTSPTPATIYEEAPAYVPTATQADSDLATQLDQAITALNARFDQFNGGAGWQRYLTSDNGGAADPQYRDTLLQRMNSVASNAQFQAVSELAEFQKVHELLQAIAAPSTPPERPALPSAPLEVKPALDAAESIPVPSSAPESSAQPGDERSVLAQ